MHSQVFQLIIVTNTVCVLIILILNYHFLVMYLNKTSVNLIVYIELKEGESVCSSIEIAINRGEEIITLRD